MAQPAGAPHVNSHLLTHTCLNACMLTLARTCTRAHTHGVDSEFTSVRGCNMQYKYVARTCRSTSRQSTPGFSTWCSWCSPYFKADIIASCFLRKN